LSENNVLKRLYPTAEITELKAALPHRAITAIQRQATYLHIKRLTLGTRTNTRFIHPLIQQLRLARENAHLSRSDVSKKSGYHVNQLCAWELGKVNPDFRSMYEWAESLGFDLVLKKRFSISNEFIPWPDKKRLMAGS
jgi:hypothetical protein